MLPRPKLPALPRVVWLLLAGRAINQLGAFTLPFLAVALTQKYGASLVQASYLLAVFGVATIASRLVGGWLADRAGRRAALTTGLALTGAAQAGLVVAPNLLAAAMAVAILGLAFEIFEPASQALIADLTHPDTRPRAYALMSAALAAAALLSGLLAAAIGQVDLRLLFLVDAATCVGAAVLLRFGLPRAAAIPQARVITLARDTQPSGVRPWRDRALLWLMSSGTVFAAIYLQLTATLGLTLSARGIEPTRAGLLYALSGLIVLTGQPLLVRRAPWSRSTPGLRSPSATCSWPRACSATDSPPP